MTLAVGIIAEATMMFQILQMKENLQPGGVAAGNNESAGKKDQNVERARHILESYLSKQLTEPN